MKFLRPFQQKKAWSPTAYSLIDVGRSTVKAAVALVRPDRLKPQIVGLGLAETGDHDITGGRYEAEAVAQAVNKALTAAEDDTERCLGQKIVPDHAVFAVAGRAVVGRLFRVSQVRSRPAEPISVRELDHIRARAERLAPQGLSSAALEGGQWQPLAVTDAGTFVDERLVKGGAGLTGRKIKLSVFGVAAQASVLRGLEVLAESLDLSIASVVAAPQALASTVPHTESIILDIGHAGTDICLIKNDALVAADWVPFGGYFFTQALMRTFKIDPITAEVLKRTYAAQKLPPAELTQVEIHLETALRRWYEAVIEALTGFAPAEPLPRRIYLTGGASQLPGFARLLRTNPAPFDAAPEVNWLGQPSLPAVEILAEAVDYKLMALTLSLTVGLPER